MTLAANHSLPPLRIAIAGADGRMGQMLIATILNHAHAFNVTLASAFSLPTSPAIEQLASMSPTTDVRITDNVEQALKICDVLIDFTHPQGTLHHLSLCAKLKVKAVIGTTGFNDAQKAQIAQYAQQTALVMAPNMSVGVNVTFKLLEMAAKAFATGYDIEIIEAHHRHKVDAPSGTALKMGDLIAQTMGKNLKDCAVYAREGQTGPRDPSSIGFSSVRGGDIIGDHTVLFAGEGERIEISHKSSNRQSYANGSLRAANFLRNFTTGLFDMYDVLGLRD